MPKRTGSRARADSRRDLAAWVARGKPISEWRRRGKKPARVPAHIEVSSRDLAAWGQFLAAHPQLRKELLEKNPQGTAVNIALKEKRLARRGQQ